MTAILPKDRAVPVDRDPAVRALYSNVPRNALALAGLREVLERTRSVLDPNGAAAPRLDGGAA